MQLFAIFVSELRREALMWWSYRLNAISTLVMWAVIFPILLVTVQQVAFDHDVTFGPTAMGASIIGFLVWRLCTTVFSAIPQMVQQEARTGVLENVVLSAYTSVVIVLGCRTAARTIRSILETLLLALVVIAIFRIPLPLSPTALLVIGLTLAGSCGIGLALAGIALVHRSVGSFVGIVATLALFISGAAVPLNGLGVVFTLLKYVFPMTWGIDILRGVILSGESLAMLFARGALPGLVLQTAVLVIVGLWLFARMFEQARARGLLGVY